MPQPRYDPDFDETRHAAVDDEHCEDMADHHGWTLKDVEYTNNSPLVVDCIFDGYCEFPASRMDLTQGDYDKHD